MTNLSKKCDLSRVYSNHSIRATGATILSRSNFNPAQIMAVTGHKSVSSLTVYQQVSEGEKLIMGQSLSNFVHTSNETTPTQSTPTVSANANESLLDLPDWNISEIDRLLAEVSLPECAKPTSSSNPIFYGCKIENFTLNVYKNEK